jgi:hypothetical protein
VFDINIRTTAFRRILSVACALSSLTLGGLALPLSASASGCPSQAATQPFKRWNDANSYWLSPGGDFESANSGWTLTLGAVRMPGSEPYAVTGKLGSYSLALPSAAVAQTPYMCLTAADRSFRFFLKSEAKSSIVTVQVVYKSLLGNLLFGSSAKVAANATWQPSAILRTGTALASAISPEGTVQLALRFTASSGSSRIDDVYIDPRMH